MAAGNSGVDKPREAVILVSVIRFSFILIYSFFFLHITEITYFIIE